ncbi:MAG: type II toxin-antitoxin system CcdA family antitoxin [Acidimicrobiales bacterium]
MPRMQVYLPDELYRRVKAGALPVSRLLQESLGAELRRQELLTEHDRYLAELIAEVGEPGEQDLADAEDWVRRVTARSRNRTPR